MKLICEEIEGVNYPLLAEVSPIELRNIVQNSQDKFSEYLVHIQQTSLRHLDEGLIVCVDLVEHGIFPRPNKGFSKEKPTARFFYMTTSQMILFENM